MVLVVPGKATASGDTIMVASILPTDLISFRLIAATTVVTTVIVAGYYMIKRKIIIAVPKGRTA
jgi:predicted secreted protein